MVWSNECLVNKSFTQEDYRELCELMHFAMGGEPYIWLQDGIHHMFTMRRPEALHNARLMGKIIYLLKMFILSLAFPLSRQETSKSKRLSQFVTIMYGKLYLTSALGTVVSRHELTFIYNLNHSVCSPKKVVMTRSL